MKATLSAVMDDLRACLCAALADATPGGEPCFCGLYPGAAANADFCTCKGRGEGCGQAWVRLDRIYPSTRFPAVDTTGTSCGAPLAAVLELGVYRCLAGTDGQGNAPDAAKQANAVLQAVADADAMRKAVTCCEAITKRPNVLGTYTPRDSGNCGGGVWPVTVHLVRV